MNNGWLWNGEDLLSHEAELRLGGKAATLWRLQQEGYPIPPFFVVTAAAFRDLVTNRWMQDGTGNPGSGLETAESISEIRQAIGQQQLTEKLQKLVHQPYQEKFGLNTAVAVRSSAVSEDGRRHSFAGIYDSVLDVDSLTGVLEAIKLVWASVFSERVQVYRRSHELKDVMPAMGVIVQMMVPARQSGVAFTSDPNADDPRYICVSAVPGCGRGLVSGQEDGDTFFIEKSTLRIQSATARKDEHRMAEHGLMETASLSAGQLENVAKTCISIEQLLHRPQDIEFCYDSEGKLFILQSRPITSLRNFGPAAGNHLVWDNSNIIESYRGVTTPMTFSFIRYAYSIVYMSFGEVMGISQDVLQQNRRAYDNMLGLFRGRVYYNLHSWYRLVRLFPGYRYNRRFMESMMGVSETLALEEDSTSTGFFRRWFIDLPALVRLLVRSLANFLRIEKIVSKFKQRFDKHYQQLSATDFGNLAPYELLALYDEMEDALLRDWRAPIINDFFVMIFFGVLKQLCSKWCRDTDGDLHNGLVCGEGELESAKPAKMLVQLAQLAHEDAELAQIILEQPLATVPDTIKADASYKEFSQRVERYLELYGLRCEGELKLEEHSWRDRPERLYQVLRNYLLRFNAMSQEWTDPGERERQLRREAEQRAFEALGQSVLGWPRRFIFRWVLRNARLGIRQRENLRFARTRIYGMLREILRAIGRQWAADGILNDAEDIFFLAFEEVRDFIRGTAVSTNLRGLVKLRRAEYAQYKEEVDGAPDRRFHTFGTAYDGNTYRSPLTDDSEKTTECLQGIGCCRGIVNGTVQVVKCPQDDLSSEATVMVAESTDPGWVPLFPAFSGLVIERGSLLSHSAIVAREMGIPTVVGVTGATEILRTGQTVRIDGGRGTIVLLDTIHG